MPATTARQSSARGAATRSIRSSVAADSRSGASDAGSWRAARNAATRRLRSPTLVARPARASCATAPSQPRPRGARVASSPVAASRAGPPRVQGGAIRGRLRIAGPRQLAQRQRARDAGRVVDDGPGQRLAPPRTQSRGLGEGARVVRARQRGEAAPARVDEPEHGVARGVGQRPRRQQRHRPREGHAIRGGQRRRRRIVADAAQRRHRQRDVEAEQAAGQVPGRTGRRRLGEPPGAAILRARPAQRPEVVARLGAAREQLGIGRRQRGRVDQRDQGVAQRRRIAERGVHRRPPLRLANALDPCPGGRRSIDEVALPFPFDSDGSGRRRPGERGGELSVQRLRRGERPARRRQGAADPGRIRRGRRHRPRHDRPARTAGRRRPTHRSCRRGPAARSAPATPAPGASPAHPRARPAAAAGRAGAWPRRCRARRSARASTPAPARPRRDRARRETPARGRRASSASRTAPDRSDRAAPTHRRRRRDRPARRRRPAPGGRTCPPTPPAREGSASRPAGPRAPAAAWRDRPADATAAGPRSAIPG